MSEIPIVKCKYCQRDFKEDRVMMFDSGLKKHYICSACYNKAIIQFDTAFALLRDEESSKKRYKRQYFESRSLTELIHASNKHYINHRIVAVFKEENKYIAIVEKEIKDE
ncbi:hypothetical protein [Brachyspira sp.]|uniref:hypothetical protein n=1 Tax=Brachyspira sp. TaxID=1977261 RepID=UPI003D7E2644